MTTFATALSTGFHVHWGFVDVPVFSENGLQLSPGVFLIHFLCAGQASLLIG